jgi:hypothetical protein
LGATSGQLARFFRGHHAASHPSQPTCPSKEALMATPDRVPEPTPAPKEDTVLVPDEIDSAKWSMPPWGVVGVVLLVIFVIIGIVSYLMRPLPKATGTIDAVYAVALPENNVMVTMKININNVGGKTLYIRNIKLKLATPQGEFSDEAASAVDFPRYFQAFPDLREHTMTAIKVEDTIPPGNQLRGSVIGSFPVSLDQFNTRKSISVTIEPYDQAPFTVTK